MYLLKIGTLEVPKELQGTQLGRLTEIGWRHMTWPLYVGLALEELKAQVVADVEAFTRQARVHDFRIDEQANDTLSTIAYSVEVFMDDVQGRIYTDSPVDTYQAYLPEV